MLLKNHGKYVILGKTHISSGTVFNSNLKDERSSECTSQVILELNGQLLAWSQMTFLEWHQQQEPIQGTFRPRYFLPQIDFRSSKLEWYKNRCGWKHSVGIILWKWSENQYGRKNSASDIMRVYTSWAIKIGMLNCNIGIEHYKRRLYLEFISLRGFKQQKLWIQVVLEPQTIAVLNFTIYYLELGFPVIYSDFFLGRITYWSKSNPRTCTVVIQSVPDGT